MKTNYAINPTKVLFLILVTCFVYFGLQTGVFAQTLPDWKTNTSDATEINTFFTSVTNVIMYVCAFVALIIIILAFKGLAGQGDWRTFWNKIAGGIGIFVVPAVVKYLVTKG